MRIIDVVKRPGVVRWLRYAVTGRLPAEYAAWVLHDTTAPTWVLRHVARVVVILVLPTAAVLLVVPTNLGIRVLTAFTCWGCALLLTGILSNEMTERRANAAGYPWGTAERTRARRARESQVSANYRRRERIAARQERRLQSR